MRELNSENYIHQLNTDKTLGCGIGFGPEVMFAVPRLAVTESVEHIDAQELLKKTVSPGWPDRFWTAIAAPPE